MLKASLLMVTAVLAACGPAKPTDTVDELVANPDRLKEIQRLCKEDRAKVNDDICMRAAQAFRRRFMGDRPEQKNQ